MADCSSWTPLHARLPDAAIAPSVSAQPAVTRCRIRGQDSLCLIKLLLDLQPLWGWQLGIAHCDHRWRPDSEANANHVEQLAKIWEHRFIVMLSKR